MRRRAFAMAALGMLVFAVARCAGPAQDPAYVAEIESWRKQRHERLASENGWLTLVGLHWLSPGENGFGSDPSNPVRLPSERVPARAGSLFLEGDKVHIRANEGAGVTLGGAPFGDREVATDAQGKPDVFAAGGLTFFVIRRGDRFAVRVKDPESPVRKGFKGIESFPIDAAYRVTAEFVPYDAPKSIPIPTVLGTTEMQQAPGVVKFRLRGKDLTLEPIVEDPADPELFFIFKDETSARETYPSGRFLYAAMPKEGKVVLDFNEAYNPPCAFTPFATCPLPPRQNWLPVRIEAGEKRYAHP